MGAEHHKHHFIRWLNFLQLTRSIFSTCGSKFKSSPHLPTEVNWISGHLKAGTDRAVLPSVRVAVDVEHRRDVEVHVLHHLLHLWLRLVRFQDLMRPNGDMGVGGVDSDWFYIRAFFIPYKTFISSINVLTLLTKYWQKAGAIHSLACIPQSIHIAFFFSPVFSPIWRKTHDLASFLLAHTALLGFYDLKSTVIPWVSWWFSFHRSSRTPRWSRRQSGPSPSAPSSRWSEVSSIVVHLFTDVFLFCVQV